jgi:glutamate-1-semialdehyde 2,1-aminomutase
MAAGCAMLDLVRQRNFTEQIEQRTAELCARLREACAAARVPAQVNQIGSMWTLFFAPGEVYDYQSAKRADVKRFAAIHRALLLRGVYLPPSQFEAAFLSSQHGGEEMDHTAMALGEALRVA